MKNIILILSLIAAVFPTVTIRAQSGIGVIGGLNSAGLNTSGSDTAGLDYSNILGYKAGLVWDIGLSKNLGLRLEPMFLQKGAEQSRYLFYGPDGSVSIKSAVKLSYLELPVLLKYSFGNGKIRPYLTAGGAASYLLSAKEKTDGGHGLPGQELDIKDRFKSLDYEVTGGGGLSFRLGRSLLFVEGRYSHGLANIYDSKDYELNTRGVQVMTGCSFRLGRQDPKPPTKNNDCACKEEGPSYVEAREIEIVHVGTEFILLVRPSFTYNVRLKGSGDVIIRGNLHPQCWWKEGLSITDNKDMFKKETLFQKCKKLTNAQTGITQVNCVPIIEQQGVTEYPNIGSTTLKCGNEKPETGRLVSKELLFGFAFSETLLQQLINIQKEEFYLLIEINGRIYCNEAPIESKPLILKGQIVAVEGGGYKFVKKE